MPKLSLDRILQSQGVGTRKYCRQLIDDGEVAIAGDVVSDYRITPDTDGLVFTLFGEEWTYRAQLYIALNKPADIECSRKPSHHPGVLTILPEEFTWRDLQPVGRLDHDTTGLAGVQLHDEPAPLAALSCRAIEGDGHRLEISLEQGKYHQVKRMLAAAGNHCSALQRTAIGRLTLESLGLEIGEWCYLTPEQLALLAP